MGIVKSCMKKNPASSGLDMPGSMKKSDEEKQFESLVLEVKLPEDSKQKYIYLKFTGLKSIDSFLTDAQKTINSMHKIRSELVEATKKLISSTEVYLIKDANTSHALIGLTYAMYAQTQGVATEQLFSTKEKFPYIKFGSDSAPANIAKEMAIVTKYMNSLEKAAQETQKFKDQAEGLAEKAGDLMQNAKDELNKVDIEGKGKALKALKHDASELKRTAQLALNIGSIVARLSQEMKVVHDVLREKEDSLIEMGKELADEAITKPVDCYKKFHETEDSDLSVEVMLAWLDVYDQVDDLPETEGEVNKVEDDEELVSSEAPKMEKVETTEDTPQENGNTETKEDDSESKNVSETPAEAEGDTETPRRSKDEQPVQDEEPAQDEQPAQDDEEDS